MHKVALITGSGRGIGAATVKKLAAQNYHICINYLNNETKAHKLLAEVRALGCMAIAVKADVSKEQEVIRLFDIIDSDLGTITALVNNVGILLPQQKLVDMNAERINKIITTNITSYFLCSREAVKRMSQEFGGKGGAIVNVSSGASRTGSPGEYTDYAASKGAIDTLTIGLSAEVANYGVRVNCVRPGFIDTDIHADGGEPDRLQRVKQFIPMKRGGKPEEVASAIAWLLSEEASFTTGSFIDVTGGR